MDNQSANDYLTRLGLDKDPFSEEADNSFYYENTELMQRLDMIQHLIGFSNQMIFITGEEGTGKTSMLKRLEYYAPDHWRICHIQASPMLSTPILLRQLTSGFDLQPSTDSDDMIQTYSEALQVHMESLERSMQTPVVLIDDAHELPADAFTMLFGFLQQDSSQARLKIALFCEPQIMTMLESPQLKTLSQNITHQLDIPQFDENQTAEYLEQRLEYASLTGTFPFSKDAVNKIYHDSEGNAAMINALAQHVLLDDNLQPAVPVMEDQIYDLEDELDEDLDDDLGDILDFDDDAPIESEANPEAGTPNHSRTQQVKAPIIKQFQSWQIGAVAVVLTLLAGVLWLTSQIGETPESTIAGDVPLDLSPEVNHQDELSNNSQNSSLVNESTVGSGTEVEAADQVLTELEEMLGEPDFVDNETTEPASHTVTGESLESPTVTQPDPLGEFVETLEGETTEQIPGTSQNTQTETTAENMTDQLEDMISAAEQSQQTAAATPVPDQTTSTPSIEAQDPIALLETGEVESTPSITGIKGDNWLRAQDDKHIVLQLMGTHDQQALSKFLIETDMGDEIAWFTTEHNGSPWYVVVKGPYSSRPEAIADIASLSAETRLRKPWPRSIANIKQAMDKASSL